MQISGAEITLPDAQKKNRNVLIWSRLTSAWVSFEHIHNRQRRFCNRCDKNEKRKKNGVS